MQQAESRLLLQVLAEYHQQHADQLGLGRACLRRMGLPQQPEALVFMIIERLLKALRNTRGWLHLPEHGRHSAPKRRRWARIEPLFGDEPWWVRDLASELGEEESRVRALLRKAAQLGHVTAVVVDRYYLSRRIDQFAALIARAAEWAATPPTSAIGSAAQAGDPGAGVLRSQRLYPPQG